MNTKAFAWVDNLVSAPKFTGKEREEAVNLLNSFIEEEAKRRGVARLFCFSEKNALKRRYMELGFRPTLDGVTTFIKEL